jgi:hypothetical protein
MVAVFITISACSADELAGPSAGGDGGREIPPAAAPPTSIMRSDLTPSGEITDFPDGYAVRGSLELNTGGVPVTLAGADVRVRFDDSGRLRSISGKVRISSPHKRIEFADPVRADVGVFTGRFLNENRDLGILLNDETDYFVYDIEVGLSMNIATGDTGEDAVKPISISPPPVGRRMLMVIDYADPMYYVYGAVDVLGAAGFGWSLNGRIPFVPRYPVAGLGAFSGTSTRTGTFPVFKILKVTGQVVDNQYFETHMTLEDPLSADLRAGYQQGFNGSMSLDLSIKDVVGIEIPLASGSGGVFSELGTRGGFRGNAYVRGETADNRSWWPSFIPARPQSKVETQSYQTHDGRFEAALSGEFGWELPDGLYLMKGSFDLTNEAMTLRGEVDDAGVVLALTGRVTNDATSVSIEPPDALLERVSKSVNDEVLPRIDEAQRRWDDLKRATGNYEIELSLRGLRNSLPTIADRAKTALHDGIEAELRAHDGKIYYNSLRSHLYSADNAYYAALDRLKAAARQTRDDDATRREIEAALRDVAARKIFRTTYRYKVLGRTVATVNVSRRILSDANANRLIDAADNVKYIKETSDRRISLKQIYDQVDDRELFEDIRDDLHDNVVRIADIEELGFVFRHRANDDFALYAVIDGSHYDLGNLSALTVGALAAMLPDAMLAALRSN